MVAWASYQNQRVKKKLLEQGKTRVAIWDTKVALRRVETVFDRYFWGSYWQPGRTFAEVMGELTGTPLEKSLEALKKLLAAPLPVAPGAAAAGAGVIPDLGNLWQLVQNLFFFLVGLRLRAVGENPAMVDAAGISVAGLRWRAVLLASAVTRAADPPTMAAAMAAVSFAASA